MASVEECERAFASLADRLSASDPDTRKRAAFDRTLSCTLTDLTVIFAGRLHDGELSDIRIADRADAQVRLVMTSDDLLALVAGNLPMMAAWTSGRIKVDASLFDLLKLRSVF